MSGTVLAIDDPPARPRRRRWIPLSLRIFVVGLGILGIFSGWVGIKIYRQHVAIAAIEASWGKVSTVPTAPHWLKRWVDTKSMRSLDTVTRVELASISTAIPNSTLEKLRGLRHLRELHLNSSPITDDQLVYVAGLNQLEVLDLRETQVGDVGVHNLIGMEKLQRLSLLDSQITDESLRILAELPNLEFLDVRATEVSDAGLPYLTEFPSLTDLYLGSTKVTDAGMADLNRIQNLRLLDIGYTEVSDVGLASLRVETLQSLYLDGTRITDAGLAHVKQLRALTHIRFRDRSADDIGRDTNLRMARPLQITDVGIRRLKRELPVLDVLK
jgi:Leucine-rich repeat (LRR) protein